jgi:hypothetical protein
MNIKAAIFYFSSLSQGMLPVMPTAMAQQVDSPQASPVPDGSVQYELWTENMNRMTQFTRDMRARLDRTAFDFDALLDVLSYDADKIIEFAKSEIAFEQYPGVLRGPKGTLFARAGNSIDQALLLAKLLRDSGYDARVAGVELDTEGARDVLRAMQQPVKAAPPFADADAILGLFETYGVLENPPSEEQRESYWDYVQTPPKIVGSDVYSLVTDTSEFILAQLTKAGATIGGPHEDANLIDEARQYFWVQYRDQASDPWTDVHPAFIDGAHFVAPEASRYFAEAVPEKMQHRLRVQIFIERKIGNRLEVMPISAPWERPIANLVGVPLTFSNIPDSAVNANSLNRSSEDLLSSANYFVPSFGTSIPEGAQFFDIRGTLIDPLAASSGGAGLFATIRNAFGDALGNVGDPFAVPTLTAQWLEFTLILPDGKEQVFHRTTFDRIGAAMRSQGSVPTDLEPTTVEDMWSLLQLHTLMVSTGVVPRGYVIESAFGRLDIARPGLDTLMKPQNSGPSQLGSLSDIPFSWADHLALSSFFDIANTLSPRHRSFRSGPALVIHSIGRGSNDTRFESIDIISNPRRTVDIGGKIPVLDPERTVLSGVWETAVEGALISSGGQISNTWLAFEAAEETGIESVTLVPGNPKPPVELPSNTQVAINIDLANGFAVITPRQQKDTETAGWWRVNLETGETLGQLGDGRGSEFTEYASTLGVVFSGILLGVAINNCANSASSQLTYTCCWIGNTLVTAMTFAAGTIYNTWNAFAGAAIDVAAYNAPIGGFCEAALTPNNQSSPPSSREPSISAPR